MFVCQCKYSCIYTCVQSDIYKKINLMFSFIYVMFNTEPSTVITYGCKELLRQVVHDRGKYVSYMYQYTIVNTILKLVC